MEIRSTWHSFVQMQMLASDVNEATLASYSHVNLSTFTVARPESLLWSWRNNRWKSGESWTINHNQSFISQSVKEDDQLKKERMNVLLEESCQKLDLNSLTFSCWSNFLLPYLLDLVSNISILRKNPFFYGSGCFYLTTCIQEVFANFFQTLSGEDINSIPTDTAHRAMWQCKWCNLVVKFATTCSPHPTRIPSHPRYRGMEYLIYILFIIFYLSSCLKPT